MEYVQPIRDREKIEEMKNELMKNGNRDYLMFCLGINTGLRISDILDLKVSDINDRTHITIREQKTGKSKRFRLNEEIREELAKYIRGMDGAVMASFLLCILPCNL